jgi:outer membrane protein OmpA-like peptidoglycan-associated protein
MRHAGIAVAVTLALAAAGCVRPRPTTPAAPDVVAVAPAPESSDIGVVTVRTPGGEVTLDAAYEATTVTPGRAPSPPAVLPTDEVRRLFGDVVASLPPPARRFLLYFDIGADTLTPASQALVPDILATVAARPAPEVSVVGHTDTTGTPAANVDLGLRRAALIRDLLVGAGLDGGLVEVTSHGESNPVVPTPDNTAEARNRRVEVTVR